MLFRKHGDATAGTDMHRGIEAGVFAAGTRVLRDPYTNKPFVGFYTTKRVGGMLVDSQAVKILTLSADA